MTDKCKTAALSRIVIIVGLSLTMAGCAGSPLGDAIAGPEAVAAREDAYCRSIGANLGTPEYANCRMTVTNQRQQRHQAAIQGSAAGLHQWGQSIHTGQSQTGQPQTVTSAPRQCVSRRVYDQIVTDCQ
jgi:hypothetical protein